MATILVLEDDTDLRGEICEALEDDGFSVHGFGSVKAFTPQFNRSEPDLLILDLGLPDGKGSDVIRTVRAQSDVGILVLSGRQDEADRIIALEYGADDFVVKPCSPRELLARINAILRRTKPAALDAEAGPKEYVFNGFTLDLWAMELHDPEGDVVSLTTAEFELLSIFAQRPQRAMTREQLTDLLRGDEWAGYDRAIDGLVSRLRKKISGGASESQLLKTIHGTGYIFTASVDTRRGP